MENNAETIFCNVFCVEESSHMKMKKHDVKVYRSLYSRGNREQCWFFISETGLELKWWTLVAFAVLIMQLPPQEGAPYGFGLVVRTWYIINV